MRATRLVVLGFLTLIVTTSLGAEPKGGPEPYKRLKFRSIGPAIGGRVCRACGVPGNPLVYYAATAAGGLWKSSDGGIRWQPIMDDMPTSTIGSIAVSPSDPNVIYVGSGEANIRGNVEVGNGIYKSTDAGKTWKHVWKQEGQIGTMIVHPTNPDIAYAAVLGKAFGPNPERGVHRTTDGGKTWQRVLGKNADTGASDVCFDPSNPRILFAGLWQTRRRPWELTSGGPGSGLYVSRDGGDSWTQLVAPPKPDSPETAREAEKGTKRCEGLPEGIWGKIGLAIAPSDAKRIYALIEAEKGGLFRSDDGGEKWTRINSNRAIQQRAWYFSTLTVHPTNPEVIFFPQVPLLKSIDGGKSLTRISGTHHGDHHDIWIDPKNPDRMIDSNDGGVDITTDAGKTWYAPPLPICQLYHIAVDHRTPYHVACTIQDIGTAMGPSHSLTGSGIALSDWHSVGGGEAGHIAIDPQKPNIVYAGEYGGYISRYDHRTRQARPISIYPYNPSGHGAEDLKYRFQWTAPILISAHDPQRIYHAANVVFTTYDGGKTWTRISDDLTRNDKSKQKWSGGPITGDNTGVEIYGTVFALAESQTSKELLWAGSDDGLVHVTTDGGKTWKNVTAGLTKAGLPEWGTVICIEPSQYDAKTAYVVVDAHRLGDRKPYLFVTKDQGETWKSLTDKMPADGYLQVVREDPHGRKVLYVGSEKGVLYSNDLGSTWQQLKLNLPTVRVTDLKVKEHDLVVGTNGRSIWIFDDLTTLRASLKDWQDEEVHLFTPRAAYRYRYSSGPRSAQPMSAGENLPRGVLITYALKKKPKGELTLEILGLEGGLVRKFTSKKPEEDSSVDMGAYSDEGFKSPLLPTEPGIHRINWDLLMEGAERIKGARVDTGDPRTGPLVVPGTYWLRLTVDGKQTSTLVDVKPDPRLRITTGLKPRYPDRGLLKGGVSEGPLFSPGDLSEQHRFTLRVRDDITSLTRTVEALKAVRKQLVDRNKLLGEDKKTADLVKSSREFIDKLDKLEEQLHNPRAEVSYDILARKGGARLYSQLIWLFEQLRDADGAPTQGMREVYTEQVGILKKLQGDWQKLTREDLEKLNTMARKLDVPIVLVPARKR
jgi:photosystem II stability/assembly factor-like uncharacterized protein